MSAQTRACEAMTVASRTNDDAWLIRTIAFEALCVKCGLIPESNLLLISKDPRYSSCSSGSSDRNCLLGIDEVEPVKLSAVLNSAVFFLILSDADWNPGSWTPSAARHSSPVLWLRLLRRLRALELSVPTRESRTGHYMSMHLFSKFGLLLWTDH